MKFKLIRAKVNKDKKENERKRIAADRAQSKKARMKGKRGKATW